MKLNDKKTRTHKALKVLGAAFLVMVVIFGGAYAWFSHQLSPVSDDKDNFQVVKIDQSTTFDQLADDLENKGLIRNSFAFKLQARLMNKSRSLEIGACKISPSQTSSSIIDSLTGNCQTKQYKVVTFYPGATIEKPRFKSVYAKNIDQDKMYIKGVLRRAGFSDSEIDRALSKQYTGDLFADKPAGSSLEGYIYGETYHIDNDASAEQVLQTTFDEMDKQIKKYKIVEGFKRQGLNLYQGITMASIVQRELNCEGKPTKERKDRCYQYLRGIAQVFLKRYKRGQRLGSDVTFIYAADKLGVEPRVDLDSPYNTRIKVGLPPGPIASPGLLSMMAVADPVKADNLFFIAGDDGLIYFAKNNQEHQANIRQHCQKLCSEL